MSATSPALTATHARRARSAVSHAVRLPNVNVPASNDAESGDDATMASARANGDWGTSALLLPLLLSSIPTARKMASPALYPSSLPWRTWTRKVCAALSTATRSAL